MIAQRAHLQQRVARNLECVGADADLGQIVGDLGDAADLPRLREMAAKSQPVSVGARGFGLMPVVDLSRVAKSAIAEIEKRTVREEPKEK